MSRQPKISVLLPCFNAEKYLHEAVDSILQQSYSNLEILLIDDGSKDNTRQIIHEYAQLDNRVIPVYNEINLGLIRTLNKGVQLATGDFIARMDADDISSINRLEVQLNTFIKYPELDVVASGYYYISTKSMVLRRSYPKAHSTKALHFVSFFCTPVHHPCVMVRASVFKENAFDENYIHSEDYEIFSRLIEKGFKFLNLEQPLYYFRINPQSVSNLYETIQISTHTKISSRCIENYYGQKFDFFQHKVMINRISFNVSLRLLLKSLASLKELKEEYITRELIDNKVISEINEFLVELKMDIFIQTLKHATWLNKAVILTMMLYNIKIFLNPRGIQYLKSKLNLRSCKL